MAGYTGAKKEIALTREDTKGEVSSPSAGDWIKKASFAFGPKINKLEDTSSMGRIEGLNRRDINQEWSEGPIVFPARTSYLTKVTDLIMGAQGTTVTKTTTWDSITNTNDHVSYTVSVIDPIAGDKAYAGGMLNTFSLDATTDAYPQISLDLMAGKEESATLTSSYTAPASERLFRPRDVKVYIEDDYASLSGATAVALKNVTLNVNKNLSPDWVLGSTEAVEFINQRFRANGSLSFKYNSDAYRSLGLADTTKAIKIELSDGSYTWSLIYPSVSFHDWDDDDDNDAYMLNTVAFEVDYQDQTNGFMKAEFVTA